MKLLIGMPLLAPCDPLVIQGIVRSISYLKERISGCDVDFIYTERLVLWKAREWLWRYARESDCNKFMFLGDDIVLARNTLYALAMSNHDVTSALYFERELPNRAMVFRLSDDGKWMQGEVDFGCKELEVDGVGLDCLCVTRKVLDALSPTVFYPTEHSSGDDLSFCEHLMRAGIGIVVRTDLIVGHLWRKKEVIGKEHYKKGFGELIRKSEYFVNR